ncbi:MAG: hypothetical protein A3A33_00345 [Candidatus Yanofskybacteria bacterium RIFCSPLOWO2_01_FULL_49_25]|uniref:EfeO-type cupredoxin-like domain-containing protein n=1 Tax=Candidatus Yanofskybacteria bacterium RIFCSPLOWO2_01_FULL_49_25 TaxID=1802701 RepID=A0A1F8GV75_9BACT|nr:MAG: hypothetical protein A3A33_00345 [Candidatus Yanofskybacteria bacterium RIFCSPLOWO2_01_FULL_49_25]
MNDSLPNTHGRIWIFIILVFFGFTAAVFYFSKDNPALTGQWQESPSPSERAPRTYTVSYSNGVFSPTNLRIRSGDTVRFRDDGDQPIAVVSELPADTTGKIFGSGGDIAPGSFFSYTFNSVGTFNYFNTHQTSERGTIIVGL